MSDGKSSTSKGAEVPPHISVLAGASAGMISRFVIAPIDVVKIRLQLQGDALKYRGIMGTMKQILVKEGIKGFWKGNVPAEIMYIMYGATQFTAYSTFNTAFTRLQKDINVELPTTVHSGIVGAFSGCVSTSVSYPFDVLRTRLAAHESPRLHSLLEEVRNTYKGEGIRGFFGGILISINYVALTTGISFGAYNKLKEVTSGSYLANSCGLFAGMISKTIVYPLDLMRRRQQVALQKKPFVYMGKRILAKEGIRGFYHGLTPALLKTAPTTAVTFWIYEFAVDFMMRLNTTDHPLSS